MEKTSLIAIETDAVEPLKTDEKQALFEAHFQSIAGGLQRDEAREMLEGAEVSSPSTALSLIRSMASGGVAYYSSSTMKRSFWEKFWFSDHMATFPYSASQCDLALMPNLDELLPEGITISQFHFFLNHGMAWANIVELLKENNKDRSSIKPSSIFERKLSMEEFNTVVTSVIDVLRSFRPANEYDQTQSVDYKSISELAIKGFYTDIQLTPWNFNQESQSFESSAYEYAITYYMEFSLRSLMARYYQTFVGNDDRDTRVAIIQEIQNSIQSISIDESAPVLSWQKQLYRFLQQVISQEHRLIDPFEEAASLLAPDYQKKVNSIIRTYHDLTLKVLEAPATDVSD